MILAIVQMRDNNIDHTRKDKTNRNCEIPLRARTYSFSNEAKIQSVAFKQIK